MPFGTNHETQIATSDAHNSKTTEEQETSKKGDSEVAPALETISVDPKEMVQPKHTAQALASVVSSTLDQNPYNLRKMVMGSGR